MVCLFANREERNLINLIKLCYIREPVIPFHIFSELPNVNRKWTQQRHNSSKIGPDLIPVKYCHIKTLIKNAHPLYFFFSNAAASIFFFEQLFKT